MKLIPVALIIGIAATCSGTAYAQRAGQSVMIQHGVFTGGRQVNLNSGAVPRGAVVGGALGLASASTRSTPQQFVCIDRSDIRE